MIVAGRADIAFIAAVIAAAFAAASAFKVAILASAATNVERFVICVSSAPKPVAVVTFPLAAITAFSSVNVIGEGRAPIAVIAAAIANSKGVGAT